ncbi:MAG: pyruvate, phosphate dikinase [Rhizobiaceae bacterium]
MTDQNMPDPVLFAFGFGDAAVVPDKDLMGTKGANLAEMTNIGLPVPAGFVLNAQLGQRVAAGADDLDATISQQVRAAVTRLQNLMDRQFGAGPNPLLLSVRSGAAVSMPGMMDTVLNLGLNSETVEALSQQTGDPRFAWDSYRRFIQSFASVVMDVDGAEFEDVLDDFRQRNGVETDAELSAADLQEATQIFLQLVEQTSGEPFPQDVFTQLELALMAVFHSWNTSRARRYRDMYGLSHEGGTAAVIQAMVFGNRDQNSCTGVYFTRNPSNGEAAPYGEYMPNAQGEEVVSGIRTPMELTEAARAMGLSDNPSMEKQLPNVYSALIEFGGHLEKHFRDMQEIEFTVESGELYLLQTRSGKRTPKAGLKIAIAMVDEGLISKGEAVQSCDMTALEAMLVSRVDAPPGTAFVAKGLPASPGVATGAIVFSSDEAVAQREQGRDTILLRSETDPRDVHGMHAAAGILTTRGGMTSHAAVVARGMAKPCITAAMMLKIDLASQTCSASGLELKAGDIITIDGSAGTVYIGEQPVKTPQPDGDLATILAWQQDVPL